MKHCGLKQKDRCLTIVVDPSSSIRQMLVDMIKDLGYARVESMASLRDVLHYMEIEQVGWLITPLLIDSDCNALQILKLITKVSRLRHTCVSLLVDMKTESQYLPFAFENGLISFHKKSYVKEVLKEDFDRLCSLMNMYQWDATLCAAEYLRTILSEKHYYKSMLALEENLLSLYPGSDKVLYHLAEAEFLNDQKDQAVATLGQVLLLNERMGPHCKRLRQKYEAENNAVDPENLNKNSILGVKNVVIIDPDTDIHYHGKELLNAIWIEDIEFFENGEEAFQWMSTTKEPDLIIMEWRIPAVSGPVLVQKIRQHGFLQVPVIVISSLLKPEDIHLLREMGVDACLDKPFDPRGFYSVLIWAVQQNRCPTEQKSLQLKIRRLLGAGKISEAERLMSHLFSDERSTKAAKLEIEAEYFFAKEDYIQSRNKGIEAINHSGDSLLMLNLVGKCMLKLKQFDGALKAFDKANNISSLNIERLLNIAESSLYLEDIEKSKDAISQVKNIDPHNSDMTEMECKMNIESGDVKSASSMNGDLESWKNVISYMNNRAISLSRNGRFEDGIDLYKKTIESIPDRWKLMKSSVYYNLGLAYARYGELDSAIKSLKKIDDAASIDTTKKSLSLMKRIQNCIDHGVKLDLRDEEYYASMIPWPVRLPADHVTEDENALKEVLSKIDAKRGDIGCYMIFYAIEGNYDDALKLTENLPVFKERSPIERNESFPLNDSLKKNS
ncbi:MAG: response regulator [Deltaproteobacteria bacterium]|nr:response regulator [Deltaproteobacteria bacterium]